MIISLNVMLSNTFYTQFNRTAFPTSSTIQTYIYLSYPEAEAEISGSQIKYFWLEELRL